MQPITPEEVIDGMEQMIKIEQNVLMTYLKECSEMHGIDECLLIRAIVQRIQSNAITLANLAFAVAQLNAIKTLEVAEKEFHLQEEQEQ